MSVAPVSSSFLSLKAIDDHATTALEQAEKPLDDNLSGLQDTTSFGVADMLQQQYNMATYAVVADAGSGVMNGAGQTMRDITRRLSSV